MDLSGYSFEWVSEDRESVILRGGTQGKSVVHTSDGAGVGSSVPGQH